MFVQIEQPQYRLLYEFYLPRGTTYEYGCSLGGKHDTTGNNQDAYGWHHGTTPELHFYGNGNVALPTQYNYSNYHGKWIKIGWVREASGNNVKVYIDGVYVSTHTPSDGSLTERVFYQSFICLNTRVMVVN